MIALLLACAGGPATPPPAPTAAVVEVAPPPPPAPPPFVPERADEVPLAVPDGADEIARRLVYADDRVVDEAIPDDVAAAWGHAEQRIFRKLGGDPALLAAVLDAVPDRVQADTFARLVHASVEIAATVTKPRGDLPDWRIVEPPPLGELIAAYQAGEAEHGVPWPVLASIHLNETKFGRLRGVSPSGALGPMQFMPGTWAAYGDGDVNDPHDAIRAAANYLAKMGWARDPRKAVWHYNHSAHYVEAILTFAEVITDDPRRMRGLWGWQVYYRTVKGPIWLSTGYASPTRMSIDAWCAGKDVLHCPALGG